MTKLEHDERPRIIALVGCTGSGKTGLGVELARALETEIISVDSMAVYRGMDIGTAKPTREERGGIVHHLIDVVEPDESFTAADFVREADTVIRRLHGEGRPALLVGGTGLYLRTLIHGIFKGPQPDPELRAELIESAESEEAAGQDAPLHRRLLEVDPETAGRLHPRDHVRIIRALEVFYKSGKAMSVWQAEHAFAEEPYRWIKLGLERPRDELYHRIELRVIEMIERGLESETARLAARYGTTVKPMKGLGYLHFAKVLEGAWSREEATSLLQRDTRRFARRQITWFRKERGVRWCPPQGDELLELARKLLET